MAVENGRFPPAKMAAEIPIKSGYTGGKKLENTIFYNQGTVPSSWLFFPCRWKSQLPGSLALRSRPFGYELTGGAWNEPCAF